MSKILEKETGKYSTEEQTPSVKMDDDIIKILNL
jgi:hypothetical protein